MNEIVTYMGEQNGAALVRVDNQFVYDFVSVAADGEETHEGGSLQSSEHVIVPMIGETPKQAATRWALGAFGVALVLPADYNAAMLAAFEALETLQVGTADELLAQSASFGIAMMAHNGPLAWSRLAAAFSANKITQAQHDAVAKAMTMCGIPSS